MQEENNSQIIKTIGEHGEEIYMKLQEVVNVGGNDYALLSVVEEDTLPTSDSEDDELIIMKMKKSDDECTFEIIEDDDEFNFVAQAITDSDEIEEDDLNYDDF